MKRNADPIQYNRPVTILALLFTAVILRGVAHAETVGGWTSLFDGSSLSGWSASENPDTWSVRDGCLVARGKRSHLFYMGPIGGHDFRDFELEIEAKTEVGANSGVFFHTEYEPKGIPNKGYEVQINNRHLEFGSHRELKSTGSLSDVRNIAKSFVKDGQWFRIGIRVVGNRVRIHVNEHLTVDYVKPGNPSGEFERGGRVLSHGTIALQAHDPTSVVSFRRVAIRLLPDDADSGEPPRASEAGYGLTDGRMDRIARSHLPLIDYHVHLRGGMTADKAIARQAVTGINIGVLQNIGAGWPIETDDQLLAFLDSVARLPLFVGLQVNDRDWHTKHSPELLKRLDYVIGDTMIMSMPNENSPPVKLWEADGYTIDDPEVWMERYVRHNLRVLAEPITILANPTYLPPAVEGRYDELWTDARMQRLIQAAIANNVALEINARSGYPSDRFIGLAKEMGAKFAFGTNNFHDRPIDMSRCFQAIEKFGLAKRDMYVPKPSKQ